MSGALRSLGSVSIGALVPAIGTAQAAIAGAIAPAVAELSAKLAGAISVQLAMTVPALPTVALAGAAQALASLRATVNSPQGASLQLGAAVAQIASLKAQIAGLQAQLSLAASLGSLAATGGISAYSYDGTVDGLGPALTSELSGGGAAHANALVLVTSSPATWSAMRTAFAV
jgi:hypothetical protein